MDIIQQVLGTQYAMFYCDKFDCAQLTPLQTLPACVATVNTALTQYGKNLNDWPEFYKNQAAKLVRANVIYQKLHTEPIRKPILVHREKDKFVVDCGDTRLMALNQLPNSTMVSVIITCSIDSADQYQHWTRIHNTADLSACTGFALDSSKVQTVRAESDADYALCWLEVGDQSTAHHLHDPQQRLHMMQHYLDQQSENYCFDQSWLLKDIKW
jgi:hypothetical protein